MLSYSTRARVLVLFTERVRTSSTLRLPAVIWLPAPATEMRMRAGLSTMKKAVTTTAAARTAIRATRATRRRPHSPWLGFGLLRRRSAFPPLG
jgi:hypothetical protein